MSLIKLIISNPFRKKSRAILSIFGLILSIFILLSVFSFNLSVETSLNKAAISGGDLVVLKENLDSSLESNNFNDNSLNNSDLDLIRSLSGVKKAVPLFVNYGDGSSVSSSESYEGSIMYFGKDDVDLIGIDLSQGRAFKNSNEVIVSGENAKDLGYEVGKKISIFNKEYTIVGIFNGNNVYNFFVALPDSELKYNKNPDLTVLNQIIVDLDDGYEYNQFSDSVFKLNKGLISMSINDFNTNPYYVFVKDILNYIYLFTLIFSIVTILYCTLSSVNDRTREIGVLKAIGWNNKIITLMILFESLVLSLIAWIIGSIISIVLILVITSNLLSYTPIFDLSIFLNTLIFILIISIIGSLIPILKATRLSPTEALRYE